MSSEDDKNKNAAGFAGLSSLVSDIEIDNDAPKLATLPPKKVPPPEPPPADQNPQPARPDPRVAPAKSSPSGSGKSGLGWVIVGVIVMGIWIANSGSGNKSQPAPSYTPPPSYTSPAPAPAPVVPVSDEQMPPEGRNNVLNIPQIRWCKREKIRIDAIESVINNAYDHEVERFNAKVTDYNSRCGEFRYRRGNVEQVDRELAAESASIATKAKSEWVRTSLGLKDGPAPAPAPAPKKEKPLAQAKKPVAGKTCQSDGECPGSQYCVLGRCGLQVRTGGACGRSTECSGLSSQCISGRCVGDDGGAVRSAQPAPRQSSAPAADSLSYEERESIESACGYEKRVNGPAAYNNCVAGKISALKNSPRNLDLSSLGYEEKTSVESACGYEKRVNGPGAYNRCVSGKLSALKGSARNIDMSSLTSEERKSIESACGYEKRVNGPGAYNNCAAGKVSALKNARRVDLSSLSYADKDAIESACGYEKRVNGPAAYYNCLSKKSGEFRR